MKTILRFFVLAGLIHGVSAADEVTSTVHNAAAKAESTTKTGVVKAKDGTVQTIQWTEKTAAKGTEQTANGAKGIYTGAKEGTDAVMHGTAKGTEKTDREVKKLGKEGLASAEDATAKVEGFGKSAATSTTAGTEHAFEIVKQDSSSVAAGIGKGAVKAEQATVHSVEENGQKVVHIFRRL